MFDLPPDALGPEEIGEKKKKKKKSNSGNENKIEGKGKFCCEITDKRMQGSYSTLDYVTYSKHSLFNHWVSTSVSLCHVPYKEYHASFK